MVVGTDRRYWNHEAQIRPGPELAALRTERLREAVDQAGPRTVLRRPAGRGPGCPPDDIRSSADVRPAAPHHERPTCGAARRTTRRSGDYRPWWSRAGDAHRDVPAAPPGRPTAMLWTRRDLDVERELSAPQPLPARHPPRQWFVGRRPTPAT